jgi:hypothetical protein
MALPIAHPDAERRGHEAVLAPHPAFYEFRCIAGGFANILLPHPRRGHFSMAKVRVLIAITLSLVIATRVESQIGGAIRRAAEQVKKADAQKEDGEIKSQLGFTLDEAVMASFKRGLEVETRMRNDYAKKIDGLKMKSREEWQTCFNNAPSPDEAQKVQQEYMTRAGNASTAEDVQKAMNWYMESLKTAKTRACGDDPSPLLNGRGQALGQAEEAGAAEFGKAFDGKHDDNSAQDPTLWLEGDATTTEPPAEGPNDLSWYRTLKESVTAFCRLSKETQLEASKKGLKVAGTGAGVFVYVAMEASVIMQSCNSVMPLLKALE